MDGGLYGAILMERISQPIDAPSIGVSLLGDFEKAFDLIGRHVLVGAEGRVAGKKGVR